MRQSAFSVLFGFSLAVVGGLLTAKPPVLAPAVMVLPSTNVNPGDPFSFLATGFKKNTAATLTITGPQTVGPMAVRTDHAGSFQVDFTGSDWPIFPGVPAGGYYTVTAQQGTLSAVAALVVQ